MKNVKAFAAFDPKSPLKPHTIDRRDTRANDVLIEVKFCGVCHSDVHQARDEWGGSVFPMVPGHEIVGVVKEVGSGVKKFKVGDKVGVGCMVDSCQKCPECKQGFEQFCHEGSTMTYNGMERDGSSPTYGGYSTHVTVREEFVLSIPDALPLDATAPLLCAGITTYSPLRHWGAGPGKKVAVMGLGGLGHMAVKIAHAMGAEVTVISHSDNKKADALKFGADHFYSTKNNDSVFTELASRFDLIINTVSAEIDWNLYLGLLARDGSMVVLGIPTQAIPVHAFSILSNRRSLAGSPIGGIAETQEMLDFCAKHGITSDIEKIPMEEINNAYDRMVKGDVKYRFVIDLATL